MVYAAPLQTLGGAWLGISRVGRGALWDWLKSEIPPVLLGIP